MIARNLAGWVCILAAASCMAQDSNLHFTIENYSLAQTGTAGVGERLGWMQITADATPHVSFTNTYLILPGRNILDETFVKFTEGMTQVRAGRVRSGFGFSDWSDFY